MWAISIWSAITAEQVQRSSQFQRGVKGVLLKRKKKGAETVDDCRPKRSSDNTAHRDISSCADRTRPELEYHRERKGEHHPHRGPLGSKNSVWSERHSDAENPANQC